MRELIKYKKVIICVKCDKRFNSHYRKCPNCGDKRRLYSKGKQVALISSTEIDNIL